MKIDSTIGGQSGGISWRGAAARYRALGSIPPVAFQPLGLRHRIAVIKFPEPQRAWGRSQAARGQGSAARCLRLSAGRPVLPVHLTHPSAAAAALRTASLEVDERRSRHFGGRWPMATRTGIAGVASSNGPLTAQSYCAASPIGTTSEPCAPAARSGITSEIPCGAANAAAIRADIRSAAATKAASGRRM